MRAYNTLGVVGITTRNFTRGCGS